jgi:Na+/melibiose symporter-like transporter
MSKDGGPITPREGTYLVGIVNMVASLVSVGLVKYIGRKTLVVWGHLLIAAIHAATGYLAIQHNSTGVICCVLAFLCVEKNTSGPVAWLYAAETTIDAALGICLFTLWGTVVILSETCPILM